MKNGNKIAEIIRLLNDIDVDGETMQYILEEVGMADQMHRQLIMSYASIEDTEALIKEYNTTVNLTI